MGLAVRGNTTQSGFTLAEVLIALLLFSVSMLGISAHIASTQQATTSVRIQANASELLLQLSEPLNRAAQTDKAQLQQMLSRLNRQSSGSQPDNTQYRQFSYQLLNATDAQQQELISTTPDNWQAPYTIRFSINYQQTAQQSYRIPQTIVLAP